MSPTARRIVIWISAPVVAFAIVGGLLSSVTAREDTYQYLKIFDDVVDLITSNYVEKVDVEKVMSGAMNGLADSLDPDSAYLSPDQVKQIEAASAAPGRRRRYRSHAAVLPAHHRRARRIAGGQSRAPDRRLRARHRRQADPRDVGLRGHAGAARGARIEGQAHDHSRQRERSARRRADARSAAGLRRHGPPGRAGRRLPSHRGGRPEDRGPGQGAGGRPDEGGAASLIVDVRRTSGGQPDRGVALARLFVASGTLAMRETKGLERETIAARPGDGSITLPTTLLVDTGTSGAAELFASALVGNQRAELIGEHTIGRAAQQKLVKLPDGSGLWLTTTRYLTPGGDPLHEKGLEPTVARRSARRRVRPACRRPTTRCSTRRSNASPRKKPRSDPVPRRTQPPEYSSAAA